MEVNMSEEAKKPKQYMPLLDEVGMACMRHIMPNMKFVEIEGMMMNDNPGYQVLVNPIPIVQSEPPVEDKVDG
jgi:hypothetical protein